MRTAAMAAAVGKDSALRSRVRAEAPSIESLGLRPLDVGGLKMAHWLEGAGLVEMGLARHGAGHWDIALGVTEFLTP